MPRTTALPALVHAVFLATAAGSAVTTKNTVVRRFEGVTKPDYHLVEQAEDTFEPDDSAIAVVDLSLLLHGTAEERERFVSSLGDSLRTCGFAVLVGHGVDEALAAQAPEEIESFFTRHSMATKRQFGARRKGSVNQGYFGVAETSNLQPDMVEGWVFCRRAFDRLVRSGWTRGPPRSGARTAPLWRCLASLEARLVFSHPPRRRPSRPSAAARQPRGPPGLWRGARLETARR